MKGKPVCLIKHGIFSADNFEKKALGKDKFFAELRMQGVSLLRQTEGAKEESSGNTSMFFFRSLLSVEMFYSCHGI